ncbi:glucosaminidase domain-containing protein [Catenovulum maritimum]|uniref:glucosaminidase domain-containing protein n=1 Tax=Catenovulum maritimum TaxID=1513271 RepID=UPI00069E4916|nr:glucosaminidase domain-containing protein [Catenovulum maritimum]
MNKKIITSLALLLWLTACSEKPIESVEETKIGKINLVNLNYFADEKPLPDFKKYPAGKQRKQAFFKFIAPIIKSENERIATIREASLKVAELVLDGSATEHQTQWLVNVCQRYKIDCEAGVTKETIASLNRRINKLPASLAIAQAANESAWGTSRFAVQANNLYGQWCFSEGCGLAPNQRNEGAIHEVRKFDSPVASVRSYLLNLNRHPAYQGLRGIRADLIKQKQKVTGHALAAGLIQYSERKHEYVEELRQMIRFNKLSKYES